MTARSVVSNEAAVRQFHAEDGRLIASIIQSGELFRFVEEREVEEPATEAVGAYWYWMETHRSGLYASLAEAVVAAAHDLPWLPRDLLR